MKKFLTAIMCLVASVTMANDGVFFVNGNQLVPVNEADISISKEVLTISIGDDGQNSSGEKEDKEPLKKTSDVFQWKKEASPPPSP